MGSSCNGLIAAYLARAGQKLRMLKDHVYRGGVESVSLILPGFQHERYGFVDAKMMATVRRAGRPCFHLGGSFVQPGKAV